jgi:hypothetical protein
VFDAVGPMTKVWLLQQVQTTCVWTKQSGLHPGQLLPLPVTEVSDEVEGIIGRPSLPRKTMLH